MQKEKAPVHEVQVKEELDIEDPIANELVGGDGDKDDDGEDCW
eukprot:CAMPEP_0170170118 /NCGR_PEP_ID=MMETSP0040_2-20121228/3075_1 /TAXON_ID=641309 /ORGANISM="Lotharella oceanica, Strain CCMP622" /LENGTH=42 /DNA_ID= /DNA_START= /DNA_END= /DNA_ORIENTATION=